MYPQHLIDVPDCVETYNYIPGIIVGSVIVSLAIIMAVTSLIYKKLDK